MLHILDYFLPIIVRTDASTHSDGAVLFQYNNNNNNKIKDNKDNFQ